MLGSMEVRSLVYLNRRDIVGQNEYYITFIWLGVVGAGKHLNTYNCYHSVIMSLPNRDHK